MSDEIIEEIYNKQDEQHNNKPFWRSKHFNNSTFSIINATTGEIVLPSTLIPEPSIEQETSINWKPSITMTMNNCEFSPDVLNILFGYNEPKFNLEAKGTRSIMVQARIHKKKRINKKWLKRYGYKEIQVPVSMRLEECTITHDDCGDGCYTVNGKIDEIKSYN